MRLRLFSALALLSLCYAFCFAATPSEDDNAALHADMAWLHLIDTGDLQAAWNNAAKVMQSVLPEPQFASSIGGARNPLGSPGGRELLHVQDATTLPGAPDGHYVIAQYQTDFANKPHAVETIVASQESDGSWHVAGYFIR